MNEKNSERRSEKRIAAKVPVTVKSSDGIVQTGGYTRDLSSSGIFLYADAEISSGSDLEIVLVLPPELTGGEQRWACCQASVARVEKEIDGGPFGFAATIRRFEFLPEIPT
jgi:PilZ domain